MQGQHMVNTGSAHGQCRVNTWSVQESGILMVVKRINNITNPTPTQHQRNTNASPSPSYVPCEVHPCQQPLHAAQLYTGVAQVHEPGSAIAPAYLAAPLHAAAPAAPFFPISCCGALPTLNKCCCCASCCPICTECQYKHNLFMQNTATCTSYQYKGFSSPAQQDPFTHIHTHTPTCTAAPNPPRASSPASMNPPAPPPLLHGPAAKLRADSDHQPPVAAAVPVLHATPQPPPPIALCQHFVLPSLLPGAHGPPAAVLHTPAQLAQHAQHAQQQPVVQPTARCCGFGLRVWRGVAACGRWCGCVLWMRLAHAWRAQP